MVLTRDERGEIELECPCCGTRLKIDASLGKVIWHGQPPKKPKSLTLIIPSSC